MRLSLRSLPVSSSLMLACSFAFCSACSDRSSSNSGGEGGSSGVGGSGAGAPGQGGVATSGGAGASSGGSVASGGVSVNGGASSGGSSSGESNNGGSGAGTGGTAPGGSGGVTALGGANTAGGGVSGGGSGGGAAGGGAGGGGCLKGADTIFCEDFESVPAGAVSKTNGYSPVTDMGSLTVDATHARGMRALHVHTDGNGKAYIQLSPFAPPQNSFFGRMYVWVTAFPTAPDYAHFTLVEAAGTGQGVIRPIGGQYIPGKGDLWGTGSDGGPTTDWTNWQESAPAQAGKWLCMEWELAAADNAINVWIDGTAKPELSVSTKMHGGANVDFVFPTFNSIWFGWWLYQSGPTPSQFDVWIDDIALGAKRQGC